MATRIEPTRRFCLNRGCDDAVTRGDRTTNTSVFKLVEVLFFDQFKLLAFASLELRSQFIGAG